MDSHNCYRSLGLREGASMPEIKAAYRKLALLYHPDKTVSTRDAEKFKAISEAYRTLRFLQGTGSLGGQAGTGDLRGGSHRVKNTVPDGFWQFFSEFNSCSRIVGLTGRRFYIHGRQVLSYCSTFPNVIRLGALSNLEKMRSPIRTCLGSLKSVLGAPKNL